MKITIIDDFDPYKIANCGQAFRSVLVDENVWRFVTRDHVLYIEETDDPNVFEVSCDQNEWDEVWVPYFDLNKDYAGLRDSIKSENTYTVKVCEEGEGIRILRQDTWEMLVTFIISQRRSIPAIRTAIEKICERAGKKVATSREELYLFPDAKAILDGGADMLDECGVGYRLPYILDAAQRVVSGELDLIALEDQEDEELVASLMEVKGVGVKVSNCIALFGFGRMACAPIDVWISRAIDEFFDGQNPFDRQGKVAGLLQQYMFYYAQATKSNSK